MTERRKGKLQTGPEVLCGALTNKTERNHP